MVASNNPSPVAMRSFIMWASVSSFEVWQQACSLIAPRSGRAGPMLRWPNGTLAAAPSPSDSPSPSSSSVGASGHLIPSYVVHYISVVFHEFNSLWVANCDLVAIR
jgi:hypothetical protein